MVHNVAKQIKPKEQKVIQQAQQFLSKNNINAAKEILLNFKQNNKLGEICSYYLCLCRATSGELNEALPAARNLVKKQAGNIEYLKLLGGIYHGLQQYDQAISIFERALKINKNDFQALTNIANALKENQQLDKAESYYKQSLATQPNQPEALTNYGLLMQVNAKLDDAIHLHQKSLQLAPTNNITLYNLAYALNEKGESEASIKVYQQVLKTIPRHVRALSDMAQILGKLKRFEEALSCLQLAVEVDANDAYVHLNFGTTHRMMKNMALAESSYNKVLSINPDNQTAKYYLAIMKGDNSISSSPDDYVQKLFDGYAETFDDQLVSKLKYKTPELIGDMVKRHSDSDKKHKILDLGCGTGLAGVYLDDISEKMIGVDLSSKMLKKAELRNIYDELVVSGIEQYFETHDFRPDIIVSADVFVYIGDLANIFSAVSRVISSTGIFVLSTEDSQGTEDFLLKDSGRFAHNEKYIRKLSADNNLNVIENKKTILRYEANEPIHGQVYLLKNN